jgi:hypothetical protein
VHFKVVCSLHTYLRALYSCSDLRRDIKLVSLASNRRTKSPKNTKTATNNLRASVNTDRNLYFMSLSSA